MRFARLVTPCINCEEYGGGCSLQRRHTISMNTSVQCGSVTPSAWRRYIISWTQVCSTEERVQYGSVTPSVRRIPTICRGEGVQYGSVTSSLWKRVCSTELPYLLSGLLVAAFIWENDLLQTYSTVN